MSHWNHHGITCNHQSAKGETGLCAECVRDFDVDPIAWLDYGPHPIGDRNSEELYSLMMQVGRGAELSYRDKPDTGYKPGHDSNIPF